jgi:hypothetical protein
MTETQWTGMAATPIAPIPVVVTAYRRDLKGVTTEMVKMVMGAANLALTNFVATA